MDGSDVATVQTRGCTEMTPEMCAIGRRGRDWWSNVRDETEESSDAGRLGHFAQGEQSTATTPFSRDRHRS